jgi:hypothetical protein
MKVFILASKHEISGEARSVFMEAVTALFIKLAVYAFLGIFLQVILVNYSQEMHV